MKKYPYSGARVFEIFSQLQRRGLAMFLGYLNGEPMIWMDMRSPLSRAPISIATAATLLDEILWRELDGIDGEVLVGEVIDAIVIRQRPQRPRRRTVALLTEVI